MRLLDSIPAKALHKLMFVEEQAGQFAILGQAANRKPVHVQQNMTEDAAKAFWRKACLCHFYSTTHCVRDAEAMADKRLETIH